MKSTEKRDSEHKSEMRDSVEVLSEPDGKFNNKHLIPKSMIKHNADQPSTNSCLEGIRLSQIASKRLKQGLESDCELRHCEFHQSEKKQSIGKLYSKYEKKYQEKFQYQQSKHKQQQEVQRDKYDSKVKEYQIVGNTWKKVDRNPENSKELHQNNGQNMIQTNTAKTHKNLIDLCSSDDELFKETPAFICKNSIQNSFDGSMKLKLFTLREFYEHEFALLSKEILHFLPQSLSINTALFYSTNFYQFMLIEIYLTQNSLNSLTQNQRLAATMKSSKFHSKIKRIYGKSQLFAMEIGEVIVSKHFGYHVALFEGVEKSELVKTLKFGY